MPPNATWTAAHDAALLTSLVTLVLANRRDLYRTPGLEDVATNGGSRINQRLLLMLRKLCNDFGERGLVDDLIRAQAAKGGRKRKAEDIDSAGVKQEVKRERVVQKSETLSQERDELEEARDVKPKIEPGFQY